MDSHTTPPILNATGFFCCFFERRGWLQNTFGCNQNDRVRCGRERGTSKCKREKEKDLGDCKHMDREREEWVKNGAGGGLFQFQICSKNFRVKRLKVWCCKNLTGFIPHIPLLDPQHRSGVTGLEFNSWALLSLPSAVTLSEILNWRISVRVKWCADCGFVLLT